MKANIWRQKRRILLGTSALALIWAGVALVSTRAVSADAKFFIPGNLVLSRSVYSNNPNNITVGMTLPPNCAVPASCVFATNDGTYPYVFNNAAKTGANDGSFGITSKIFLDQLTTGGLLINSLEVPNNSQHGVPPTKDQAVTSFSSKSEIALNLSTDGQFLVFMAYRAPIDAIDVSNSNTPGVVDPTNPVGESVDRLVVDVDAHGELRYTRTNAYSGNNGRAAILNNTNGANVVYTSGNAGNGSNPQPDGILIAAGAQILTPEVKAEEGQHPGIPTPVGSFSITQLGNLQDGDKIGKDDNFRGLTIHNNVLYLSKGSGGNGINTVYWIDPIGTVCNDANGVGLPSAGATLPTSPLAYNPSHAVLQSKGLDPNNMCILKGFPTALNKNLTATTTAYPFGLWFASDTVLYVADEGDGSTGKTVATFYNPATASNPGGLQKWILVSGTWQKVYTLTAGLNLGMPYAVPNSASGDVYPIGNNSGTGGTDFPWAPATDGLRNITGVVNGDGTATIYAITSTISGSGDQGADPNKLVVITDKISATTLPAGETFTTLRTATFGEVLRGVSFTPGTVY